MRKGFTPLHPENSVFQSADEWCIKLESTKNPRPNGLGVTGFTLIEVLLVLFIFTFLFVALLNILTHQDRAWHSGYNKMEEQQEARRAMDSIVEMLRQSNPNWVIGGVNYSAAITGGTRLDFYVPVFDVNGGITSIRKVTYKINPNDAAQLLLKVGTEAQRVVANNLSAVSFSGGCAGCAAFNCSTVADDCPVVDISITTIKERLFTLTSKATLRNINVADPGEIVIEEPQQGEF